MQNADGTAVTATPTPPEVVASSLTNLVTVAANPGSIDLTFSEALNLSTVQAGDLILTGPSVNVAANSFSFLSSNTLRFGIAGLTGADGVYTLSLSGINDLAGESMAAVYSQDFTLDTTGPSIVGVTTAAEPGDVTIVFTFDQDLNSEWFNTGALTLHELLSDQYFYYDQCHLRQRQPSGQFQLQCPAGRQLSGLSAKLLDSRRSGQPARGR